MTPVNKAGHKGVKDARMELLPPEFLWGVAKVYSMGAEKYSDRNWERGYEYMKSYGAMQRHLNLWLAKQDNDEESGLNHLLHAAWMIIALYTFHVRDIGVDDRPTGVSLDAMKATLLNPEDIVAANEEQKIPVRKKPARKKTAAARKRPTPAQRRRSISRRRTTRRKAR
jgi:Domain of unknown function (DUF5664)